MNKLILSMALIIIAILSCKKEKKIDNPIIPEKKVSWWVMDGDTFKTTEVKMNLSNGHYVYLHYENVNNDTAFAIQIDTAGRNLNNDSFGIYGAYHGFSPVNIYFNRSSTYAIGPADSGSYIYSTVEENKLKVTLPPTYFHKLVQAPGGGGFVTSDDTTVVKGVFYEP